MTLGIDGPSWEVVESRARVENYGSEKSPSLTIYANFTILSQEVIGEIYDEAVEAGLISRETIPVEPTTNFRGSPEGDPYFKAKIDHEEFDSYEVLARDTGGILRTKITYKPIVKPEKLKRFHPADFKVHGVQVFAWELHNYKHKFTLLGLFSKKYGRFDLSSKGRDGVTEISADLMESSLSELRIPCAWHFDKLEKIFGKELRRVVESELRE